jgi:hypothetical protein
VIPSVLSTACSRIRSTAVLCPPKIRRPQFCAATPTDSVIHRLHKRYSGKDRRKIITAVGRELLGFVRANGIKAEAAVKQLDNR